MLVLLHIMAYFPARFPSSKMRRAKKSRKNPPSILSVYCVQKKLNNHRVTRKEKRFTFEIHNRKNSFMFNLTLQPPRAVIEGKIYHQRWNWKNEEAEISHKISGKNNFLCFDINDDDAWLNVYVIVNTKWSIKICFGMKSTVFIRFHSSQRMKGIELRGGEDYWVVALSLRDNFY